MLYLNDQPLTKATSDLLVKYQSDVNAGASFAERVAKAKTLFSARNKKGNKAFKEVRAKLALMSGGIERCNYCEDSKADEVEHIYPKNFFPDKCFLWANYCYACGPCNGPKNDLFAIFASASRNEIVLNEMPDGTEPPAGDPLLVDPRTEQPMEFLFLDLANTFKFTPFMTNPKGRRRAEYTIATLGLNSRSYLVRARRVAFSGFKSRLFEYVTKKEEGATAAVLNNLTEMQKSDHHQTVWFEMKRQRSIFPEIDDLLNRAPEALSW